MADDVVYADVPRGVLLDELERRQDQVCGWCERRGGFPLDDFCARAEDDGLFFPRVCAAREVEVPFAVRVDRGRSRVHCSRGSGDGPATRRGFCPFSSAQQRKAVDFLVEWIARRLRVDAVSCESSAAI